ncbi:hypothetical protein SCUCBS95973_007123 [Sporothrix curviconia]|uniref:Uncharacterized protein n=1 Tax=Sporothrix curviconia TaxID=1260050 RepID=A0ABP0CAT6_9PEZI
MESSPDKAGSPAATTDNGLTTDQSTASDSKTMRVRISRMLHAVAQTVDNADPDLDVTLPDPLPRADELLSLLLEEVRSRKRICATRAILPPIDYASSRRDTLRRMALEMRLSWRSKNPLSSTVISSDVTLTKDNFPKPMTWERHQRLKEAFKDVLENDKPWQNLERHAPAFDGPQPPVLPQECTPNDRSAITLGQRGLIDQLQYTSIPRSILHRQDQALDDKYWGRFELVSYVDADGDLIRI